LVLEFHQFAALLPYTQTDFTDFKAEPAIAGPASSVSGIPPQKAAAITATAVALSDLD